jgi:hypothetical protein
MIEILRRKIWTNGKVDFFTVILLLLLPAIPAIILGLHLLGLHGNPSFISESIDENKLLSWLGLITLTGNVCYMFFCLDKATDYPAKTTSLAEE